MDFGNNANRIFFTAKGAGKIQIRLDERESNIVAEIAISNDAFAEISAEFLDDVSGIHDLYIVFDNEDIILEKWHVE